ncbi:hypothetical protein EFV06_25625 [Escherichia coli]|nr:hypothetical protein EFV16_25725 [Escherichia coli]RNJ10098.1 hypothetical protein EFV06_25625 [Escherichia coli]
MFLLNTLYGKLPYCANYSLIQGRQTGILHEKKKAGSEKPADGYPSNWRFEAKTLLQQARRQLFPTL